MARRARIVVVSDSVAAGRVRDVSGLALSELLEKSGFALDSVTVVADGRENVATALRAACAQFSGLVVTTGGTGFSPRDETPEGTSDVLERTAPGFAEAMRAADSRGRLSRGLAGSIGSALVLNLPGSPDGATTSLTAVLDVVPHALALLAGEHPHPHPQSHRTESQPD